MSEELNLLVERDGPIVIVTMNRPQRKNALTPDMIMRMAAAWEMIDGDDEIRCAILTGAGDSFCVGGDLIEGWMTEAHAEPTSGAENLGVDLRMIDKGLLLSYWLRKPLIAAVNGPCLAGGCEILQQTDIRVAEENATFGLPEARWGLIARAGSTIRLKRQIPYPIAMEVLLAGRELTADEALSWGFVNHVVPIGESLVTAREIAMRICRNGPLSVLESKASAVESGWLPEEEALVIQERHAATVLASDDAREGMRAFVEKRRPQFLGH